VQSVAFIRISTIMMH